MSTPAAARSSDIDRRYGRRRTAINVTVGVIQSGGVSLALLLTYQVAIRAVGSGALGEWLMLFAWANLTQVALLGLTGSSLNFIPKLLVQDGESKAFAVAAYLLRRGAIQLGALQVGLYLCLQTPAVASLLPDQGHALAPLALLIAWFMGINALAQTCVDGLGYGFLRSIVVLSAALLNLTLTYFLTAQSGVRGFAYAVLAQHLITTVTLVGFVLVLGRRSARQPTRISKEERATFVKYGLRYQFLTLPSIFIDPLMKYFISLSGLPSLITFYELVNRIMQQANQLLLMANQSLLPRLNARLAAGQDNASSFPSVKAWMFMASSLFFPLAFAVTLWAFEFITHTNVEPFLPFIMTLAAGWYFNSIGGPAYFTQLSQERLNTIILSNYLLILSILIGGAFISSFHLRGSLALQAAVTGLTVGMLSGYVVLMKKTLSSYELPSPLMKQLISSVAAVSLALMTTCLSIFVSLRTLGTGPRTVIITVVLTLLIFIPAALKVKSLQIGGKEESHV